jgi:endonuclease III
MTTKQRYQGIIEYFSAHGPEAETELNYSNPFELLVAVILSAQCTDKRVNIVTKELFKQFPTAELMANAQFDDIFPLIRSISYPNNKTKHLIGMAKMLIEKYGSEVPDTVEALQQLPGVGRKTANVIVSVVYNQPKMAVDTHVYRVSKRIGLAPATATTPLAVENALYKYLPKIVIPKAHHWLILHGRYTCLARKPKCKECGIKEYCKYFQKNMSNIIFEDSK